jgi:hypothetical protein
LLGFDRQSWDEEKHVWSDDRYWRQLSLDQQHAAENIGYTQEVLSPFSPLACLRTARSIAASMQHFPVWRHCVIDQPLHQPSALLVPCNIKYVE